MAYGPDCTMDRGEYQFILNRLVLWLQIRLTHEPRFREMLENRKPSEIVAQLGADIQHSALLHRLICEAKEPLPVPPPLVNAYPDYEAGEREQAALSRGPG